MEQREALQSYQKYVRSNPGDKESARRSFYDTFGVDPEGFSTPRTAFQKKAAAQKLGIEVEQHKAQYEEDIGKVKREASKLLPMATAAGAAALVPGGQALSLSMLGQAASAAALGGAAGEAYRIIGGRLMGFETSEKPLETAASIAKEGATQAAYEVGGRVALRPVEKLAGRLKSGLLKPAMQDAENAIVRDVAQRTKAPLTVAEVTNSPGLREVQKMAERSATGIGKATTRRAEVKEALTTAMNKTLDEFGAPQTAQQAAGGLRSALEVADASFHEAADKLYKPFREATQNLTVPMSEVRAKALQTLDKFTELEYKAKSLGAPGPLKEFLTDLTNLEGKRELVKTATGWTSKTAAEGTLEFTDKLAARAGELAGVSKRAGEYANAEILMGFKRDIRTAQKQALEAVSPDFAKKADEIRNFYREGAQTFREDAIARLMKKDGEAVLRSLKTTDDVLSLKKALAYGKDAKSWDATRRYYAQQVLKDPLGSGEFALEGMVDRLNKVSPEIKSALGSSLEGTADKGAEMFRNLREIGLAADRVQKVTPMSSSVMIRDITALTLMKYVKLKAAATFGAARLLGAAIIPRIAESPRATRMLIDGIGGLRTSYGKGAAQIERAVDAAIQSGGLASTVRNLDQVSPEGENQ
jgi:hypothetical protein